MVRQMVYLTTSSLGIIYFYGTSDTNVLHILSVSTVLVNGGKLIGINQGLI